MKSGLPSKTLPSPPSGIANGVHGDLLYPSLSCWVPAEFSEPFSQFVQVCTPRSKNIHISWMRIDNGLHSRNILTVTTLPKIRKRFTLLGGIFIVTNGGPVLAQGYLPNRCVTNDHKWDVSTNLQLHTLFRKDGNQRVDGFRCQLCLKAKSLSGDPENSYRVNSDVSCKWGVRVCVCVHDIIYVYIRVCIYILDIIRLY